MDEEKLTCCFSGHRPSKLPWGHDETDPRALRLKDELDAHIEGLYIAGCRNFICGMAMGCDMYFAEAVLKLREAHSDVTLEAAVPCTEQSERWTGSYRARYDALLSECDEVTFLQHSYTRDCMNRRNRYMVDRSDVLLTCYDGQPGGTMNTILYAERRGLKVIIVNITE